MVQYANENCGEGRHGFFRTYALFEERVRQDTAELQIFLLVLVRRFDVLGCIRVEDLLREPSIDLVRDDLLYPRLDSEIAVRRLDQTTRLLLTQKRRIIALKLSRRHSSHPAAKVA